ncbi:MAG: OsmC family protein [Myxococcales bacterium]|nr:OsmC family protein [Myxococcales bacterium]
MSTKPTAIAVYHGELRTECTHLQSGNTLVTDAPCDNRGRGEAFSPTDLLATALGSCILTIMGITARDHGIDLAGTRVEITKIMASEPRRVDEVVMRFHFPKERGYSAEQRRLIESVAGTSPVPLSVHPNVRQTIEFAW